MCHFYWYGPSLSDGVFHIMNFGADFVFSSPQKSLYSEFGSLEFQNLKASSLCAIFIGTGNLYLMLYCIF